MTARRALAILTLINLFNYLDRYVVAALVKSLGKPSGLGLSDTEAGLLMSGFLVVYMIASPVFGALGDRSGRPKLIFAGVLIWSLATVLGGFAVGFVSLFAARALVGIGEAAYGTIAPGLIADLFSKQVRGRVMSVFFMAIPVGSALGFVLGGLVDKAWGWRAAFFIAGTPGILLSLLALRLPDPPRGAQDDAAGAVNPGLRATYGSLLRNPRYVMTVIGYAAYTFALGGLAFWMPTFLERVRGVPNEDATAQFGAILVVTGFLGTFIGGFLGDLWLRRNAQAYLWLSGLATLAAAPLAWVVFADPRPEVYMTAIVAAELLLFTSTGPINSVILNVVSPTERASAVALSIFAIHTFGDVPSPAIIGAISDSSSLGQAVLIVPFAIALSGLVWCAEAALAGRAGVAVSGNSRRS